MFDSILLVFFVVFFVVMVGAGWKITRLAEEVDEAHEAVEASLKSELREIVAYNFLLEKFGDVDAVVEGHSVLDSVGVIRLKRILWDVSVHAETCEEEPDFLL